MRHYFPHYFHLKAIVQHHCTVTICLRACQQFVQGKPAFSVLFSVGCLVLTVTKQTKADQPAMAGDCALLPSGTPRADNPASGACVRGEWPGWQVVGSSPNNCRT